MSRILLVDDSPHAQRMGERILSDEGYEVVAVSNADSALIRLDDVDPDVVIADTIMPGRTGFEICQYLKMSPRHRHVRVILTAGALEPLEDDQLKRVEADSALKKPFEASALLAAVRPLAEAAARDRAEARGEGAGKLERSAESLAASTPFVAVIDAEQVRAAVTVALDAAMASLVDEIAGRVIAAFRSHPPEEHAGPVPVAETHVVPIQKPELVSAPPAAKPEPIGFSSRQSRDNVRRVTPLRRPGSILGLDLIRPEPEEPESEDPDNEPPDQLA